MVEPSVVVRIIGVRFPYVTQWERIRNPDTIHAKQISFATDAERGVSLRPSSVEIVEKNFPNNMRIYASGQSTGSVKPLSRVREFESLYTHINPLSPQFEELDRGFFMS